jgi:hypothetical protein
MCTLEDLIRARAELQWCIDNFDDALAMYRTQLAAQIQAAYKKVCALEDELTKQGTINDSDRRASSTREAAMASSGEETVAASILH